MILNDVITDVRRIVQDTTATFRYSDAVLLAFANQALKRISILRPDLFAKVSTVTCTQGAVIQSAPADSIRVMEVFSVQNGSGVIETDRESLNTSYPSWMNDAEGACVNWMRHIRNPNKFFIYPKAPAAQVLDIEYAQSPPVYAGDAAVALLPDAYFPVVVDATVFITESVDAEHVTSQRAQLFLESFSQSLGVATQSREVTDPEKGGLKEDVA